MSVPFALAAVFTLGNAATPDVLVTEDGKLSGFRATDGALAVNRHQPNAFTAENWKRAFEAERFRKPVLDREEPPDDQPRKTDYVASVIQTDGNPFETAFQCDEVTCVGRLSSGGLIVHTSDVEEARIACVLATVVILDDATLQLSCANPSTVVITKRDLARYGSAAIYLPRAGSSDASVVRYAVAGTSRPWHQHRAFSREARGLPSYRPNKNPKPATKPGAAISAQDANPPYTSLDETGVTQTETAARQPQSGNRRKRQVRPAEWHVPSLPQYRRISPTSFPCTRTRSGP